MKIERFLTTLAGVMATLLVHAQAVAATGNEPKFIRDISPILSANCFPCHGPDANARKAKLRLDTKEGLFEKTPKRGPAVVAGQPGQSELCKRIYSADPEEVMPPPKSHKTLKPEQKELLKQWIASGASWQGHWAYVKPERSAAPDVHHDGFPIRNPIDAFVLARLQAKGLKPGCQADPRALVRRLSLDLTGLPPSPEVVEAFVQDSSQESYLKLVRQFMGSAQWGEHQARYWLDAARYADSHGLHFDNYREIWPYRDWVIKAFNSNLPFDRFAIWQLAGDLLPDPTDDQEVATGFERCNMTTNEGGTIEEENQANYANDRVTTASWVFLGTTMNCCACHDHKFDPFTMKDFYSMSAFFRNTTQSGYDQNIRESDVYRVVPQNDHDRARWHALPEEIKTAQESRNGIAQKADAAFGGWLEKLNPERMDQTVRLPGEVLRVALNEGRGTNLEGCVAGTTPCSWDADTITWCAKRGPFGYAPVFAEGRSIAIPDAGDFNAGEPFSGGAWVLVPKDFKGEGAVLAKMGGEDEKYRGWDLLVRDDGISFQMINRWPNVAMEVKSRDAELKRGEWQHVFFTYDGSGRTSGVKLYINGLETKANRDNNRFERTISSPFPLRIGRREFNNGLNNVAVQDARLHRGQVSSEEIRALAAGPRLHTILAECRKAAVEATNNPAHDTLKDYFLATQCKPWIEANSQLAKLSTEQQSIRGRSPLTLVQVEKKDSEPTAHILFRGAYDKPKDKVGPATPDILHPFPADAPKNRLGLAQWIVSPENPLTARVTVNRFWAQIFGTGIAKSTEDFGTTSESPSHPELLDWLAVEFRESGWDVKHIVELIVTSSAYRQSADVTPEKLEKDPQNRLLSRGPRYRMDAEMVRDTALCTSGLLVEKVGGRSVRPYQPDGIWEAVAMPESNTRYYERDSGESLYRRSLYTFWKRAAPPPTMEIFNAPSREICTVRRERTNTPLQALATLNDPQFIEAARHLAELSQAEARGDDQAIQFMAGRVLSRPLTSEELAIARSTLNDIRGFYKFDAESARRLVTVGDSKPSAKIPLPQLAAMTLVASQLMNLDEAITK